MADRPIICIVRVLKRRSMQLQPTWDFRSCALTAINPLKTTWTNEVMNLFGFSGVTSLMVENDSSGVTSYSRIAANFVASDYFVQFGHFDRAASTENYTMKVRSQTP
jgi:hypothetical protein